MSTIRIKTKQSQLVDTSVVPNKSATVFLEVNSESFNPNTNSLQYSIHYYYEKVVNEGELDEAVEKVTLEQKAKGKTVTEAEAIAIGESIQYPNNLNLIERRRHEILMGAFAIVVQDSDKNWGLSADDWEVA